MGAESVTYQLTASAQAMKIESLSTSFAGCPMAPGAEFNFVTALTAAGLGLNGQLVICDNAIKQALDSMPAYVTRV